MSGTKEGAVKAQVTIRNKYGRDDEGRSIHHRDVGSIGGKAKNPIKGFGRKPERAIDAGRKGGARSKRDHVIESETDETITYRNKYTDKLITYSKDTGLPL